jgi:hypothetical protein
VQPEPAVLAPQVTLIALEEVAVAEGVPGTLGTEEQLPPEPPQLVTKLVMEPDSATVPALSAWLLSEARV